MQTRTKHTYLRAHTLAYKVYMLYTLNKNVTYYVYFAKLYCLYSLLNLVLNLYFNAHYIKFCCVKEELKYHQKLKLFVFYYVNVK